MNHLSTQARRTLPSRARRRVGPRRKRSKEFNPATDAGDSSMEKPRVLLLVLPSNTAIAISNARIPAIPLQIGSRSSLMDVNQSSTTRPFALAKPLSASVMPQGRVLLP